MRRRTRAMCADKKEREIYCFTVTKKYKKRLL